MKMYEWKREREGKKEKNLKITYDQKIEIRI